MNSGEIDLASEKYSELKSSLVDLKKSLSKKHSQLNSYQKNFLLPALSEIISSSLNAPMGSKNKRAIGLSVADADADDYVRYWLDRLGF
ncbi:TPA: hypothetical protein ACX3DT_004574 [Vibrio parahaemolyticus]